MACPIILLIVIQSWALGSGILSFVFGRKIVVCFKFCSNTESPILTFFFLILALGELRKMLSVSSSITFNHITLFK